MYSYEQRKKAVELYIKYGLDAVSRYLKETTANRQSGVCRITKGGLKEWE